MTASLDGHNILVTGGTRGVGRGIVDRLVEAGAQVCVCHRQPSPDADRLAQELKATGGNHQIVLADVTQPADIDRVIDACRNRFGSLHALVHNAGAISHIPFAELPLDEWRRVIDTSLTAAFLLTQKALPILTPDASVIYVGSKVATVGVPMRAHYTAAQAGLIGLTRSVAKELGGRGIRVNLVAPGIIDGETLTADKRARYEAMTALGRVGQADEVGGVVQFLASDLSRYVTGETIHVDGGI